MKAGLLRVALVLIVTSAACHRNSDDHAATPPPPDVSKPDPRAALGSGASGTAPQPPEPPPPPSAPDLKGATQVTLPAGTRFGVRLNGSVDVASSKPQDVVDATVIQPYVINEVEIIPAGAKLKGRVASVDGTANDRGRAAVTLEFTTLDVSGDAYPISAKVADAAPATKGRDAEKAGIPAGGEKVSGGKNDAFPKGSVLSVQLGKALTVKVPKK